MRNLDYFWLEHLTPRETLERLIHLCPDKIHDEVEEVIKTIEEFLFDGGEVFRFCLIVVIAILGASLAPTAGIEGIDDGTGTNSFEGIDHPLMVLTSLPELVKAILAFEKRNCFVDIEKRPLVASQVPLPSFTFQLVDENFDFVWPLNCFPWQHRASIYGDAADVATENLK